MQTRSETTRTHILTAAQELFARTGYDAAGVAEICAAAGVSKGAFYHHFPSKQALFLTLLEDWLADVEAQLEAILSRRAPEPQTLIQMSSMFGPILEAASGQLPVFLEFWIQAQRDPVIWQATIEPYHRFVALFSKVLDQGFRQGSFRPFDANAAARTVIAFSMGILLQAQLDPRGADWALVAQQGMHMLMEGMARPNQ